MSGFLGVLLVKEEIQEPPPPPPPTSPAHGLGHGTAAGPCGVVSSSGDRRDGERGSPGWDQARLRVIHSERGCPHSLITSARPALLKLSVFLFQC